MTTPTLTEVLAELETTDSEVILDRLVKADLSDGFPVIPPTEDRINQALTHTKRRPDEVLATIPANFTELTVRSLARVGVMAGCRPEYLPVLIAAFDALDAWTNLPAVTSTTGGYWMALIVNGPITDDLGINCGTGLFGPGYRANATIGRAISLTFLMEGGVYPGTGTMASQGHQGRYTYCFGENQQSTAWSPLHTDQAGMDPMDNAVTVVTAHAPQLVSEGNETNPPPTEEDVLKAFARCGAYPGAANAGKPGELVFVMSADHAQRLAATYTKDEVKDFLYEQCRLPYTDRPLLRSPDDAIIVVAGGPSNMSSVIHTFTYAGEEAVTAPIP